MKMDLFHNRIVKDTMTEVFEQNVREGLLPIVEAAFPEAREMLMYEDFVADKLIAEGFCYYPLTVVSAAGSARAWVRWPYVARDYASASPYSYIGWLPLSFELVDEADVPDEFVLALAGRACDYDRDALRIGVKALSDDPLILAGRYSQTFVDELASQITHEISGALALEGLSGGAIELELVFAPGTYMEHTSENVTYRRLLLVDGASKPRDFWVKWTRVGGGAGYTVSDHIADEAILFEIGEDVPHKIREKEYRFLCSSNPATYQAAMGKRAATEWRDIIKRAVRRGEITKLESELVLAEREPEVRDEVAELLGNLGYKAEPEAVAEPDAGFASLMDMAREALKKSEAHIQSAATEEPLSVEAEPEENDDGGFSFGGLDLTDADDWGAPIPEAEPEIEEPSEEAEAVEPIEQSEEELVLDEEAEEEPVLDEEPAEAENAPEEEKEPEPADVAEPEPEIREHISMEELLRRADLAAAENAAEESPEEEEPIAYDVPKLPSDPIVEVEEDAAPEIVPTEEISLERDEVAAAPDEEQIRREIEARLRLEYEAQARAKAEAELERLIAESRALKEENERLAKAARESAELHKQALSDQLDAAERARATEEILRRELEAKERQEARERDRLAEAARIAVEEQRRREAEEEAERLRIEAEQREAEERARAEEAERLRLEAEEREAAERQKAEELAKEQERLAAEAEFMSKRAKIIFRTAPDTNVIARIKEIIEQTVARENKKHVRMHMRAYREERDVITLDIIKMPKAEQDLLVAIVKAIGNARIGVSKIIIE